jgi:TATA-binding protein-associated factor Taf7
MKARTSDDGQIIEDKNEMQSMATEFYKTLYTSEGVHDMNQVLEHVPRKVTQAMNAILTAEFEPEEVKKALSRCSRLKLPNLMAT